MTKNYGICKFYLTFLAGAASNKNQLRSLAKLQALSPSETENSFFGPLDANW
jgi:hypothetical protein